MFGLYTDTVALVLKSAAQEARRLREPLHDEHVVLAMFEAGHQSESEGSGLSLLQRAGVTEEAFRARLQKRPRPKPAQEDVARLLGADIDYLLERALQMALDLGSPRVGSEHLLLAVLYEGDRGASALEYLDLSYADARELVLGDAQAEGQVNGEDVLPLTFVPSVRKTRSAVYVAGRARQLAMYDDAYRGQTGSHHYLLALMMDSTALATRALDSFGLSYRSVADRVEELRREPEIDADAPGAPNLPRARPIDAPDKLTLSEGQREALRDMGRAGRIDGSDDTSRSTRAW